MNRYAGLLRSHEHVFLGAAHARNERRTWIVIAITVAMMVAEITAGTLFGSMALVADGWHMSTHATALLVAALAYGLARRHAHDSRFTFGTGKFGDLAAFASAMLLGLVAVLIGWESLNRLVNPVGIDFAQATVVAVIGLLVNLGCAWLLRDAPHGHDHGAHHHQAHHHPHDDHHHDHDHHHDGHAGPGGRDNNLHAAYMHVLADALTSVLAIAALLLGSLLGWTWLDPLIGLVGAVVIGLWTIGLMRRSGAVLLDYRPDTPDIADRIRRVVDGAGDSICDLHVWQVGPGHHAAIVSIAGRSALSLADYRARLGAIDQLSHLTVELEVV